MSCLSETVASGERRLSLLSERGKDEGAESEGAGELSCDLGWIRCSWGDFLGAGRICDFGDEVRIFWLSSEWCDRDHSRSFTSGPTRMGAIGDEDVLLGSVCNLYVRFVDRDSVVFAESGGWGGVAWVQSVGNRTFGGNDPNN